MTGRPTLSLRARLTLIAALAAAVVLTVGALVLYNGTSSALDEAVTTELRIRAEDVSVELSNGIDPLVGGLLVTQVLDTSGTVVVPAGRPAILEADEIAVASETELIVEREVPSVRGGARILARPVDMPLGPDLVVAVAGSTAPIDDATRRLALVLGVLGPILVLMVGVAAWLLTGAALRPVRRMTRRAATISSEDRDARLPQPPGSDEIAELGQTLNEMLDRLAAAFERERTFVDDASHELRTPLAVLRGELELARLDALEGADAETTLAALDSALDETDRLARLADQLLVLARADAGQSFVSDALTGLRQTAEIAVRRLAESGKTVEVEGTEVLVRADPDALERLVANPLLNAMQWSRRQVLVEVGAESGDAVLRVHDDGPGFGPDALAHALERFGRGDAQRSRATAGVGLGLAIVDAVAHALGGRASVSNGGRLGGGCVEIRLPQAARDH